MTIRLYDPGGDPPEHVATLAPRPRGLQGLRIGVLANGKVNGDVLARETARLFVERQGCSVTAVENKGNATRICPPELLASIAGQSDLLITAVGD
jgi:hypothetical protein